MKANMKMAMAMGLFVWLTAPPASWGAVAPEERPVRPAGSWEPRSANRAATARERSSLPTRADSGPRTGQVTPGQRKKPKPVDPVPVEPPKPKPVEGPQPPLTLLPFLPKPGKVVESKTDPELGITDAWLENGVRVHHRYMGYTPNEVYLNITLAGGQIEETSENAGITQAAGTVFSSPATSRLSEAEMTSLTANRPVVLGAGAVGDAFVITVQASPDSLEFALQKVHALLTDGKIGDAALQSWKRKNLRTLWGYERRVAYKAAEALEDLLSGSDPRRTYLTAERISAPSVADAQAWYDRLCLEAPIEVAVVGDIKLDQAMPLIQRYLGSLPTRSRSAEHLNELRRNRRPKGPLVRRIEYETASNQAMVIAGFVGCDRRSIADERALQVAALIVDSRMAMTLRDRRKLTTSIRVRSEIDWVYDNSGRFRALARCPAENVDKLAQGIHAVLGQFGREGPTGDEMNTAKQTLYDFHDNVVVKQPLYWMEVLKHNDLHGRTPKAEMDAVAAYKKLTPHQVKAVFNKYYPRHNRFTLIVVPKGSSDPKAEKPKG